MQGKEKINKGYAILGIMRRNFMYLSEGAFVLMYEALVRSHLESIQDWVNLGFRESTNESHQISNYENTSSTNRDFRD